MEQKTVKIISLTATNFGVFKALELDFEKFKSGFIAFKGTAGAGKTTAQNAIKQGVQGRASLADASQFGDEWETETQLIDGERRIFIGAKKAKDSDSITYKLYEKDDAGKKVMTPVIDGMKATPSKYMELISTELTFGIKDFLNDNKTVHRNFMFALFRPELEKFGVVFDKKNPDYEKSILGILDGLTEVRDSLRARCQHEGAFAADFQRDGHTTDALALLKRGPVQELTGQHTQLLIDKGALDGNTSAGTEKKKTEVAARGSAVIEKIRKVSEGLKADYEKNNGLYALDVTKRDNESGSISAIYKGIEELSFINDENRESIFGLKRDSNTFIQALNKEFDKANPEPQRPVSPIVPLIENNTLRLKPGETYHIDFNKLFEEHREIVAEYMAIQPEPVNYEEIDKQIEELNAEIEKAKAHNTLIDRYELNREWIDADATLNEQRQKLAALYAKVNTGVPGLKMKPFFNEEKMEIKTVYTGEYDQDFFHNKDEERLLLSYSSTQRPIIGVLLQVARLKLKSKMLPYIFIDDVPMDSKSREIITRIAQENGLTIITSMTGDYSKEKLTANEILIEGGEVFFSK